MALQICGHALQHEYKNQFAKLVRVIAGPLLNNLKAIILPLAQNDDVARSKLNTLERDCDRWMSPQYRFEPITDANITP